jgi:hypothetical protein
MVTITSQTLYYHIDSIDISDIINIANIQLINSMTGTCDASPERLKMRPPGPRPMDVTMSSAYAVARSSACFAVRFLDQLGWYPSKNIKNA